MENEMLKVGDLISFDYGGKFYAEGLVVEDGYGFYILNNCHSNNNGHSDKSKYKFSLKFDTLRIMSNMINHVNNLNKSTVSKINYENYEIY